MTDWVRLWHDMPTDPKWRVVARKSGQPLPCVIAVFNMMMVNASANQHERGTLAAWDDEDCAAALDMDHEAVSAIRQAMQGKVLDGDRLAGWEKRQPKREDSTAAKRKEEWRERQRNAAERSGTQEDAPETETETETDKKSSNEDSSVRTDPPLTKKEILEAWHERMVPLGFPAVRKMTSQRERQLAARLKDSTLEEWQRAMDALERSAFCRGENDRGWRADFDFLLQPKSFTKLLEGAYDH